MHIRPCPSVRILDHDRNFSMTVGRIMNNVIKFSLVQTPPFEVVAFRLIKLIQFANKHLINITQTPPRRTRLSL